ncbi:Protein of unknown function [Gryllus bimaculatus]|nr:Protein of unknown function [Gryllus bimaculatus]
MNVLIMVSRCVERRGGEALGGVQHGGPGGRRRASAIAAAAAIAVRKTCARAPAPRPHAAAETATMAWKETGQPALTLTESPSSFNLGIATHSELLIVNGLRLDLTHKALRALWLMNRLSLKKRLKTILAKDG